ncbi:MAG: FAD-dependent oxidoreductase, partial [Nitrospirae bacterium]|nr:FAD-dependent oxidoreductase [Nitrospirota bacterium]
MKADVVIVGAGVVGSSIARELSRYRLRIVLLEKEVDFCYGASGANGGVIHAGFHDPKTTLKGQLNAPGNAVYPQLARELKVPYQQVGHLIVAVSEEEVPAVHQEYETGRHNGVEVRIVEREELHRLEPNLTPQAICALYAPAAGIVDPLKLTIALAENAQANGVEILLQTPCTGLGLDRGKIKEVHSNSLSIATPFVVNAAGVYA